MWAWLPNMWEFVSKKLAALPKKLAALPNIVGVCFKEVGARFKRIALLIRACRRAMIIGARGTLRRAAALSRQVAVAAKPQPPPAVCSPASFRRGGAGLRPNAGAARTETGFVARAISLYTMRAVAQGMQSATP